MRHFSTTTQQKVPRYYFEHDVPDSPAKTISSWLSVMEVDGCRSKELELARREHGTGMFWCTEYGEFGETGDGCGKSCDAYSPRNGKNGSCRYSRVPMTGTGEKRTLSIPIKKAALMPSFRNGFEFIAVVTDDRSCLLKMAKDMCAHGCERMSQSPLIIKKDGHYRVLVAITEEADTNGLTFDTWTIVCKDINNHDRLSRLRDSVKLNRK